MEEHRAIQFLNDYLKKLRYYYYGDDFDVLQEYFYGSRRKRRTYEVDSESERVARLADEYGKECGINGSLFRDFLDSDAPFSALLKQVKKKIDAIPRIITAIERRRPLPPKRRRKPGRPRVSPEKEKLRLTILERWERARDAKTSRDLFCKDWDITVKQLENYQRWRRQRETRKQ